MGKVRQVVHAVLVLVVPGLAVADTVVFTTGGMIPNCRILKEEGGTVHLRTPGGYMGVPKEAIARIDKAKSVFDEYDAMHARLRAGDAAGAYKLALWCKETAGLRQEADGLLRKTIAADPNHVQARKLLGHYREGGEWKPLLPLALCLRVTVGQGGDAEKKANGAGGAKSAKDEPGKKAPSAPASAGRAAAVKREMENQLSIILKTRTDAALVADLPRTAPLDGAELAVHVVEGRSATALFYGQAIRGPATHATVDISPSAEWIGKKPLTLHFVGEVPGSLPDGNNLPIIDALTRGTADIHALLDKLNALRLEKKTAPPPPAAKNRSSQS